MEEDPDPVDDVDDPVLPAEGFPAAAVDPAAADPVPVPAPVSLAGPDPDEEPPEPFPPPERESVR